MSKFTTWALALGSALIISMSYMLDNEHDAEQAIADDLIEAQATAEHEAQILARCKALRGPRAEILHIRNTDDYACRVEGGI